MVKFSSELKHILENLQQELLVNIDEAKAAEFYILESFR